MSDFHPRPVVIETPDVRLEPLSLEHRDDLLEAGGDPEIWRFLAGDAFAAAPDAERWIRTALEEQAAGARIPFAIVDRMSERAVGSTSYLDIQPPHRSLEIGWTWLARASQRSFVNTQCKLALLEQTFDVLGAVRVQFKTDARNVRSQDAIQRIGAVREGTLRRSMILPSGYVRDSVYFSIIDSEWPAVRDRLMSMLDRAAESR